MSQEIPEQIREQKILVVDDNPASLYATSRVLRSAGFEVIEADNGTRAIALAEQDISLLVLDINLPDIDGFEVCRQLRARSRTAYLPIVHLSATYVESGAMDQGLAAGADSYLVHPADPAVLIATVKALLFARKADIIKRTADTRFRTVFELASSGIALLDPELHCLDVNPAFCAIAGSTRRDLLGCALASLIAPAQAAALDLVREELEQRGHWQGMLPVARADGSLADVEWRIASESGAGARIAIATDITDQRRAEDERERLLESERAARAEAERSNRLKDEFLAMLSHELRNPLNAILGWAKVLGRVPDTTPLIRQGIDAIERNSRLQSHLIADLLDFAGIQFGKMRFDLAVIDPAAAIRAAVDVVAPQALAKGVRIESRIVESDARVMGDESRLQQVVWNLLSNAIKFTPKDGRIEVSAQRHNDFFEIQVADTGQGINPDFLPRIFDRFSQQDSGAAKSFAGLGIGLTIVRHLVEAHRGTIEAHSDGEGCGASFTVRLPLTEQKALPSPVTGPALLSGIHVLVVEDDGDARALVARLLNDAGARVTEAAGADEALAQVAQSVPHVLVSDIGMAKRDGYQLMRALRAGGHSAERLPAIALTAFTRAEDRHDAIEAGFQIHLAKPVNVEALSAAVAKLGRPLVPPQRSLAPAD
jgi:PAS domain S-box-containing protein